MLGTVRPGNLAHHEQLVVAKVQMPPAPPPAVMPRTHLSASRAFQCRFRTTLHQDLDLLPLPHERHRRNLPLTPKSQNLRKQTPYFRHPPPSGIAPTRRSCPLPTTSGEEPISASNLASYSMSTKPLSEGQAALDLEGSAQGEFTWAILKAWDVMPTACQSSDRADDGCGMPQPLIGSK